MRRFARLTLLLLFGGLMLAGCGLPATDNHPLVGKRAPEFTTVLLDNTPFALEEHLGRDVVILDFWATWCGPCRRSLPILAEVAGAFKDRGVKLYAVDLGETAEEIRPFLESSRLDLTVVMDPDGTIAEKYLVEGIPQTVIIDRDGVVRRVHVGMLPNLKSDLTKELNALAGQQTVARRQPRLSHSVHGARASRCPPCGARSESLYVYLDKTVR